MSLCLIYSVSIVIWLVLNLLTLPFSEEYFCGTFSLFHSDIIKSVSALSRPGVIVTRFSARLLNPSDDDQGHNTCPFNKSE